jgi:enoyl-CoA hydratase/carnithine racemase
MLRSERIGTSQLLTIDREGAGNALSLEVADGFMAALDALEGDTTIRSVIITGAGDRFFCTGGDVKRYRALTTPEELERVIGRTRAVLERLEMLPLPVIAAVNGYALGGGMELVLASDIRLAARHATFALPQVRLGIITGWNGIERLVRDIGFSRALRMVTTGERISAGDAVRLGIVNEEIRNEPVIDAALALANSLVATAPLAVAAAKRVAHAAARLPLAEAKTLGDLTFAELWFTGDHREAEAAFAEKREPVFRGE